MDMSISGQRARASRIRGKIQSMLQITVDEMRKLLIDSAGVEGCTEFGNLSDDHRKILVELNEIGGRNIKTKPPETCKNIDETVYLSTAERDGIMERFTYAERLRGFYE